MTKVKNKTNRMRRMSKSNGRHATSRLRRGASRVTHNLKALGGVVTDTAYEKAEQVGAVAADYFAEGRQQLGHAQQSVVSFIRKRPVQTVLLATCAGLLFGRFCMRR